MTVQVLKVDKAEDYGTTGKWVVTTCTLEGGIESEQRTSSHFDGVILCQGFFRLPHSPHIPGMAQEFKGRLHHVSSYRNPEPFKGRTVIVVGEFDLLRDRTGLVSLSRDTTVRWGGEF